MQDVAQLVGVSKTTVAHVLNNTRPVAHETRRRVLEAVRQLNYHKNAHARRLARGGSDMFGLLISDIQNPFFPELISSFQAAALQRGFDMLLFATNYDPSRTHAAITKMIENEVRGVAVMTSQAGREVAKQLSAHRIPVVFLDLGVVKNYISNIRFDYLAGVRQAVEHLLGFGHRDFGIVTGPETHRSASKYAGVMIAALRERSLFPRLILRGNQRVDGGVSAVQELVACPQFPTAILCSNDLTAIGLTLGLQRLGIKVPDDVSVIGSDDIPFAALVQPPLTTVQLDRAALGFQAFDALERMLKSNRRRGAEYVAETRLVIRESTGLARKHDLSLGHQN